ncbi:Uncharacterised protein [Vibrio cholerae]|nr:Uncharacterised protein [Vibrio cholerae]
MSVPLDSHVRAGSMMHGFMLIGLDVDTAIFNL